MNPGKRQTDTYLSYEWKCYLLNHFMSFVLSGNCDKYTDLKAKRLSYRGLDSWYDHDNFLFSRVEDMFSAHCRPGVCHYPESCHYLHKKSIRPLCLAERPTPTVTRIPSPIAPVSSNFCCLSTSYYCPLLERLPWRLLPFASYRGADKSLAWRGRKRTTATEDFEFHISYL